MASSARSASTSQDPSADGADPACSVPRSTLLTWGPGRARAAFTSRTLNDPQPATVWGEGLTRLELRLPDTAHGTLAIRTDVLG